MRKPKRSLLLASIMLLQSTLSAWANPFAFEHHGVLPTKDPFMVTRKEGKGRVSYDIVFSDKTLLGANPENVGGNERLSGITLYVLDKSRQEIIFQAPLDLMLNKIDRQGRELPKPSISFSFMLAKEFEENAVLQFHVSVPVETRSPDFFLKLRDSEPSTEKK